MNKKLIVIALAGAFSLQAQAGFIKADEQDVLNSKLPQDDPAPLPSALAKEPEPQAKPHAAVTPQPKVQAAAAPAKPNQDALFNQLEAEAKEAIASYRLKNSSTGKPALTLYREMQQMGIHPERAEAVLNQIAEHYLILANSKLAQVEQRGFSSTSDNKKSIAIAGRYIQTASELKPTQSLKATQQRHADTQQQLASAAHAQPPQVEEQPVVSTETTEEGKKQITFSLKKLFGS